MTKMLPNKRVDELVERLTQAAGSNLRSVILYGSAVSQDFQPNISDINVLCVLRNSSFPALFAVLRTAKWWNRRHQPVPLFMTREELENSADVFAIEFLDIKQRYQVLFGEDVLANLKIPMHLHRTQVEYELREKLLLLRQKALLTGGSERRLKTLLFESQTSFLTLFRHALIALGEAPPAGKREAVRALAVRVGFDPSPLHKVLDARERKADLNNKEVEGVFASYVSVIEQVVAAVDRMLDQD